LIGTLPKLEVLGSDPGEENFCVMSMNVCPQVMDVFYVFKY
jgi:hypothetical protein